MKKKKVLLFSLLTFFILGTAAFFGVRQVVAEVSSGSYPTIVQNIANKFGLSPVDVQQVFTDTRKQEVSDRLEKAVQNGKITEDQKNQILSKQDEINSKVQEINNKQLTQQERMDDMVSLRTDLEKWATDNNIPLQYVMEGGMMRKGVGFGGGHRGMMMNEGF
jgi:hypothetical protein